MRKRVGGVLLFFALAGLAYSLATPAFEAPDEVWHYAYLRHLAEQRTLPALDHSDNSGAYQEVAQPPLYYIAAALASGAVPDDDLTELIWPNPGFGYQAGGTVNDNKNMLVHTARERFPWHGAVLALRLARFVSLVFGLLAVVCAWGLGREAFPHHPARALGVAALVAFSPQFLFISAVASNDSASAALSTAALWVVARTVRRGTTLRRSLVAGLLVGLAAAAKTSGLLLLPLALAAVGLAASPAGSCRSAVRRAGWLLACGAAALAVGGGWYLRNALFYGDPLGLQVHVDTPWGRPTPASLFTLLSELPQVHRSFWGAFGWGHVEYPPWVYLALGGLMAASLVGWLRTLQARQLPGQPAVLLLVAAWCALVFIALLQWMRQVEAPHGRLLFPAIGAWAVLVVGGWCSLHIRSAALSRAALAGIAALSLLTPWAVIHPAFAPPPLVAPADAAASVQGTPLTYGDAARLLGVALEQESVPPGGRLAVRACWQGLAPMERDYTVFVHLVGRENARVGERHTYPGLGRFPTSLWPVGQAFCDIYRLQVEDWAPTPELYDVLVGLYDRSSGERLAARGPDGSEVGLPALAWVRVAPETPPTVTPERPLDYRLGDGVALIGYRLSGTVQSSAFLTVTLYWRAVQPPQGDYAAFVHLLGADGTLLAQHDGPPRYGRYPTWAWQAGDVVPDEHVLALPDLAPGQATRLVAGMYRPDTLERLPALGPDGPAVDNLVELQSLDP